MELKKGYKMTEVGVIPEDWEVKKISDIAIIERGKFTPRPRNNPIYYNGEIPFVQTGDVTRSNGNITTYSQTLNEKGLSVSKLFKKGTILMTIAANIGYSGILEIDMACPDSLIGINGVLVDNLFLNSYLIYKREDIENLSTSGAQKNLSIELFRPFKIPYPPNKEEQTAIATALSDMDELITSLHALLTKKRQIKKATMQQLLTPPEEGGKRLEGFSGEWEEKKLEDVCDLIDPHPSHRAPEKVKTGIPFLGIGDLMFDGMIKKDNFRVVSEEIFDEHQKRYDLREGLLGLGRVASIGKVVKLRDDIGKFVVSPTLSIVRPHSIERNLLFYILNSKYVKSYFRKIMSGSTRSSVGMMVLRKVPIILPSTLKEQTAIAQILSDMDAEIAVLTTKLNKYESLKQGMMQELLTGKTRLV